MSAESFRFLHASNLHLDTPLQGLAEVPPSWQDLLVSASYSSAERVFQAAIREEVDFLLLSGDVLDTSLVGPRALAFLCEQFEQLRQREITVYWGASQTDIAGNWMSEGNFPPNVQIFPSTSVEEFTHVRGDRPLASILGRSWNGGVPIRPGDFRPEREADFRIAVACGGSDMDELQRDGIAYWALGGLRQSRTLNVASGIVHYPGSPQGFGPQDGGPRGCTLVSVDTGGEPRLRMIETDSIRWLRETVRVRDEASRDDVRALMQNQLRSRLGTTGGRPLLVSWSLVGVRRFGGVNFARLEEDLLAGLRSEFANGKPPAWTVSVEMEAPESLPSDWADEDSLLGDFLRTLKGFQEDQDKDFSITKYLPDGEVSESWKKSLGISDVAARGRVLQEAAILGVELLRGDDPRTRESARLANRFGKERISS